MAKLQENYRRNAALAAEGFRRDYLKVFRIAQVSRNAALAAEGFRSADGETTRIKGDISRNAALAAEGFRS